MKRYQMNFKGSVSFNEDDLVEKHSNFNSCSEEEKKVLVIDCLYKGVGSHPDITSFELFGSVNSMDDDDFNKVWEELEREVNEEFEKKRKLEQNKYQSGKGI